MYAASKAAAEMLMKYAAIEVSRQTDAGFGFINHDTDPRYNLD